MLTLFEFLRNLLNQISGGASPAAPASVAVSTSTSKSATSLEVVRDPKRATADALFGTMSYGEIKLGYSMERTAVAIPESTYSACLDKSPHLGYVCPHLKVPERDMAAGGDAGIRIHIANEPRQIKGCIAIGLSIDGDAIDNSKDGFDKMMAVLPQEFTVIVSSL